MTGTAPPRVLIIGSGLIGTSIGLALRAQGREVWLADRLLEAVDAAVEVGAGYRFGPDTPIADLVVICVPPASVGPVLAQAQRRRLGRHYTDVASVKQAPIAAAAREGCDLSSYVAEHPMAGSERSGPRAARGDLFVGRTWAFCPTPQASAAALEASRHLALLVGATPYTLDADIHDRVVAKVSHAPHVISSVLAAMYSQLDPTTEKMIGPGLRDVTRIAAGDASLWSEILVENAECVAEVLRCAIDELTVALDALSSESSTSSGPPGTLVDLLVRGNDGRKNLMVSDHQEPARR